jgi:hypothetical protein
MELVLEFPEVESLLREALAARGIAVPEDAVMRKRINGKKNTMRVVFASNPRSQSMLPADHPLHRGGRNGR